MEFLHAHWALGKGADEQAALGVRAHRADPGTRALWDYRRRGIAEWPWRLLRCYKAVRAASEHSGRVSSRECGAPERSHCRRRSAQTSPGTVDTRCGSMAPGAPVWHASASPGLAGMDGSSSVLARFLGFTPAAGSEAMSCFGKASGDAHGATSLARCFRRPDIRGYRDSVGAAYWGAALEELCHHRCLSSAGFPANALRRLCSPLPEACQPPTVAPLVAEPHPPCLADWNAGRMPGRASGASALAARPRRRRGVRCPERRRATRSSRPHMTPPRRLARSATGPGTAFDSRGRGARSEGDAACRRPHWR